MANDLSRRWMMIGMCCVHVRAPGAVSRTRAMIIIDLPCCGCVAAADN